MQSPEFLETLVLQLQVSPAEAIADMVGTPERVVLVRGAVAGEVIKPGKGQRSRVVPLDRIIYKRPK